MYELSTKKTIVLAAMALIFLLSACQPAQPTQNPSEIGDQVATSVALTVAAQNALAQSAPTLVPQATNTTLPTQTEVGVVPSPTLVLPTATAVVVASPTLVSSGGGGGGGTRQSRSMPATHSPVRLAIIRSSAPTIVLTSNGQLSTPVQRQWWRDSISNMTMDRS